MERTDYMKKKICLVFACILTALSIAGCSMSEQKEKVTLSVWASSQDQEVFGQMIDSFEEYYAEEADFEITLCEEEEYNCKEAVLLSPAAAADVYVFVDDQKSDLVRKGALLPVTIDTEKVIEENGGADSVAIDAASYEGTLYAYPLTASNGYFLYYNADYFTKEDVKSLEKMLDIAAENGKKFAMDFKSGWYLYSFFEAAGLDVYMNADGETNTCEWNSTDDSEGKYTGVEVTESLLRIAGHDGFLDAGTNEFVSGVRDGTIIAGVSGTWDANVMQQVYGDGYRACMLPSYQVAGDELQMHSVVGYKLVGVNAYTQEPEWSQRLAEWLTNEENQLLRFRARGEGPSNVKAAASEMVQESEAISALNEQTRYGHLQSVTEPFWDASYQFGNIISAGNVSNLELQDILDEMVEAASGTNDKK